MDSKYVFIEDMVSQIKDIPEDSIVSKTLDDNDAYKLYYWDISSSSWQLVWDVPNYDVVPDPANWGMQTRPNPDDDTERYMLASPIVTNALKFEGNMADTGDKLFSVSEIQAYGVRLIEVEIDIKPGSFPSSINLRKKGVTPVAIHTTQDFDATTVDPETVKLNGVAAVKWEIYDCDEIPNPNYIDPIATPDEPEMIGDGDDDLVLYFDTQELGAGPDPALEIGDTEATLTGETFDGDLIEGTGDVRIVKGPKT